MNLSCSSACLAILSACLDNISLLLTACLDNISLLFTACLDNISLVWATFYPTQIKKTNQTTKRFKLYAKLRKGYHQKSKRLNLYQGSILEPLFDFPKWITVGFFHSIIFIAWHDLCMCKCVYWIVWRGYWLKEMRVVEMGVRKGVFLDCSLGFKLQGLCPTWFRSINDVGDILLIVMKIYIK